eukprot:TRINITY_DN215_c0_g1::TRINITY_DN215_c0_g1_i1::g.1567::m.1567 TRINITY_DN215_c0_g1::TRINITY_DN215_c0_g1_i1::g.1567  ORF type:complete len:242 (+),score=73.10,sp/Q9UJU6/DBNL_HUMAN/33.57/2e-11,Cofilin_ADF/PF00241.15/3.7e-08 TRINITY_DN215_c0_g1_i1:49-726(+)
MANKIDEAALREARQKVFTDSDETDWALMVVANKEIKVAETGKDDVVGLEKLHEQSGIAYLYVRVLSGDSDRQSYKFVFLTWIGGSAKVMDKAKINSDKPTLDQIFSPQTINLTAEHEEDATMDIIKDRLKKASGANYDLGNERSGVAAGRTKEYKQQTKDFFSQKEKEGNIGPVKYVDESIALARETPVDLAGRPMTRTDQKDLNMTVPVKKDGEGDGSDNDQQ